MLGILTTTVISFILYAVIACLFIIKNIKRKHLGKLILVITIFLMLVQFITIYITLIPITIPNMVIANLIYGIVGIVILYGAAGAKPFTKTDKSSTFIFSFVGILAVITIPVLIILNITVLNDAYEAIPKKEVDEAKPLDKDSTPITVSPEFARNKVQKAMSVVPNTQFYDLGKLQVQTVKNEIVFIAPVEFIDFWKYLRGGETEGYFSISATNVNAQPTFVDSKMKYTNSSFFQKNIQRAIYNAHPSYIQSGKAQIEVDDSGKPWYVQTLYKPIGLTNKPNMSKLKVAVVNPQTGNVEFYDTDKAPEFIDGSISSEMASDENIYFGKYVHGWLNSVFGKRDVKIPNKSGTESNVTPIFDHNGDMFYFTDMTSPKENIDSALGYTLVNARTGELTYYNGKKNNGIMDSYGAIEIVNKEFPEKKWKGSMPILYNIDGNPTWIVNVLDPNGLFKQYAYIKASDSDFVVFGDTARQTLDAYRMQIAQDPSNPSATGDKNIEKRNGTVDRLLVSNQKSGQVVQFLLVGDQTIYTVNASNAPLAIFLKTGDVVELTANISDGSGIVEKFIIEGLTK